VLYEQRELDSALAYHQQALAIRKKEGSGVAQSLDNIGRVLWAQGKWDDALAHYQQALLICRQLLGEEDLHVAWALKNIGVALQAVGDLTGAAEHLRQSLVIYEKFLGPNHPNTQSVRENLASMEQKNKTEKVKPNLSDSSL